MEMTMTTPDHIDGAPIYWPQLPPLEAWQDTCATLHMWTQILGKIRLELSPDINHCWGSTLYVTTQGLTTSPIPYGISTFALEFDFIAHVLRLTTSQGAERSFALHPIPIADFYRILLAPLCDLVVAVVIFTRRGRG